MKKSHEGSKKDKKSDKKMGYKEGGKADKASDYRNTTKTHQMPSDVIRVTKSIRKGSKK